MDWDWNRACHLARLPLGSPEANDEWGDFQARLRLLAGRVAGSFGKSTAAADALASDVQAKLVSKPDRLCPTERTSTFDGWLFGVLKHQAIDNWRAMQRESKRVVVVDSDVLAGFPDPRDGRQISSLNTCGSRRCFSSAARSWKTWTN